jgi:hypothetical protein
MPKEIRGIADFSLCQCDKWHIFSISPSKVCGKRDRLCNSFTSQRITMKHQLRVCAFPLHLGCLYC